MEINSLTGIILNTAINIHKNLGPGLFESVYESILSYELINQNLYVERQKGIPLKWKGIEMEQGFRADLIVNRKVIIEIKSVESIAPVHAKQLLTYLKLTNLKVGLLINFNEVLLKNGFTRIVNGL